MNRLEKCELLKSKGYSYDFITGKIFGSTGKEIKRTSHGYISIGFPTLYKGDLKGHHFAFYMTYGNVDFEILDHINQNKIDNRICNLRSVSNKENTWNSKSKGYTWDKRSNKWLSRIMVDNKSKHLGYFNTEEEAKLAYIKGKNKHHILDK